MRGRSPPKAFTATQYCQYAQTRQSPPYSYRPRRTGERKRKSVRGCIVGSDLSVLNLGACRPSTVFVDVVFFDGICNRLRFIDTVSLFFKHHFPFSHSPVPCSCRQEGRRRAPRHHRRRQAPPPGPQACHLHPQAVQLEKRRCVAWRGFSSKSHPDFLL